MLLPFDETAVRPPCVAGVVMAQSEIRGLWTGADAALCDGLRQGSSSLLDEVSSGDVAVDETDEVGASVGDLNLGAGLAR
jgi:hypothetical protein